MVCALFLAAAPCDAGTIIKLSLGGDPAPDIEFTGGVGGFLSTADDSIPSAGDQNTAIEYVDFLEAVATDIDTSTASFTLKDLEATEPATILAGTVVFQNFVGGTLELYDPGTVLLLSGTLATSALSGTLGPPGTGGLFTTNFATVTDGTLAPYIDVDSMTLSVALADINGGAGLSVVFLPPPVPPVPNIEFGVLNAFTADASLNIAANFSGIPEPASLALSLLGAAMSLVAGRRGRR
jgi:hypothetical protein